MCFLTVSSKPCLEAHPHSSGTFKRGVTERGVFAFACQYIVSPHGRTGNRTVTQVRHPLLVEGRPNCARQSLASALSAPRVAATSYCHPGRHANVIIPCLLTPCLNVPKQRPPDTISCTLFMCSLRGQTVSSKPCLETLPSHILQTPSAGHCLGTHGYW